MSEKPDNGELAQELPLRPLPLTQPAGAADFQNMIKPELRGAIGPDLEVRSPCVISPRKAGSEAGGTAIARTFWGWWDTGATASAITARVARECELVTDRELSAYTASGLSHGPGYLVDIELPNGDRFADVSVGTWAGIPSDGHSPDIDVVLGTDLITQGEFAITRVRGQLGFTFRLGLPAANPEPAP